MNYTFGFDYDFREKARTDSLPNFTEADAAAKKGTLQDLVDEVFGDTGLDDRA